MRFERLRDITAHPALQTALALPAERVGREGNDRECPALRQATDLRRGLEPVHLWHLDVLEHDVVALPGHGVHGFAPVAYDVHLVPPLQEHGRRHLLVDRVVLGQEDPQGVARLGDRVARAGLVEAVGTVLAGTVSAPGAADLVTPHPIAESRHALRILLAEDNPVNQQVATAMLLKRGHQVDVVSNGREAVDAVTRERYDVVLMDIQMPEMDGFEATAKIRGLPQGGTLPIIALTAHALSGERERCLERGMSGYVAKPFKAHDLFAAVEGRGTQPADTTAAPSPAVDLAAFRRSMEEAGAAEAVDGILETFVATMPQRLDALAAAARDAEAEPLQRAAHAFKSAAGTIDAGRLAALLEDMERAARDG